MFVTYVLHWYLLTTETEKRQWNYALEFSNTKKNIRNYKFLLKENVYFIFFSEETAW